MLVGVSCLWYNVQLWLFECFVFMLLRIGVVVSATFISAVVLELSLTPRKDVKEDVLSWEQIEDGVLILDLAGVL